MSLRKKNAQTYCHPWAYAANFMTMHNPIKGFTKFATLSQLTFLAAVLAILLTSIGQAGTVVPIPATPGVPVDTRFTLKVNGKEVFVGKEVSDGRQYRHIVDPNAIQLSVACFDMDGTVTIEATTSDSFTDFKVMPGRLGIDARKVGNTLTFELSEPKKLIVRVDGIGDLIILATPLETDVPSPDDPGVHYYGPGTHDVGRLKVGSNETVYIAGGARFIGTIEGEAVENVQVRGRGVLDGSMHTTWDDRIFALIFDRSRNIKIEGIRIREAYWWVTLFLLCEQVEIEHLFIFSNHRNNGGIMVDGCNELTVRDSLFITFDDCICPHAHNAAGNGEPVANHYLFEDTVLWQTGWGNAIRIGASFETSEVLNWTFRRIDVINYTEKGAAIYSDHSDWAAVRNLRFIDFHDEQAKGRTVDMRIDETTYSSRTGYRENRGSPRGNYDGLYFVNLTSPGGEIRLRGYDADHKFNNVHFYNCKIGSNKIESVDDITINEYVTNLHFVTDGSTPPEYDVEPPAIPAADSPQELIINNTSPKFQGVGFELNPPSPTAYGGDVHVATVPSGFSGYKAAIYEPMIEGEYDVYIHWGDYTAKATNARWIVHHAGGYRVRYMDQNESPGWHFHGRYTLNAASHVRLALPGYFSIADNVVVADAVKFVAATEDPRSQGDDK